MKIFAGKGSALIFSAVFTVLPVVGSMAYAATPGGDRLTTEEIRQLFTGVRDDARVQDAEGTSAVNYWCADGTFSSNWSNGTISGKVIGRWRAINDQRCIVADSGLDGDGGLERCGPILRDEDRYLSVNPDSSIHGIHTLSPLTAEENRAQCQVPHDPVLPGG